MNILDDRWALDGIKITRGLHVSEPVSRVSSYIKVQKIKARTRELEKYLCDEIYAKYDKDGIDTLNRFTNHLDSLSDDKIIEIEQFIEKFSLLETIIKILRLDRIRKNPSLIKIPKIFESIEIDGITVTSLEQLLSIIETKQTYLYAPSVSRDSRKRDKLSFGYDSNRHTDKDFTLMRFLCLRGYKNLLIQKQLYP